MRNTLHMLLRFFTLWINISFLSIKDCAFMFPLVNFLGFIASGDRLSVDSAKIKVIVGWPQPSTMSELQSFLGLASFYRQFIKGFNHIVAPLTDLLKNKTFDWSPRGTQAILCLKDHPTYAPVLVLPHWSHIFEISCDTSKTGIGVILSHNNHHIEFFSEKVKQPQVN